MADIIGKDERSLTRKGLHLVATAGLGGNRVKLGKDTWRVCSCFAGKPWPAWPKCVEMSPEKTMQEGKPQAAAPTPDPARWRILAVLLATMFMSMISVSIVNVVLPSLESGLGSSQADIQWVLAGYSLTFGVVLVAAGRAGDVYGRGAIFLTGVVLFTLSSVAAGMAPDPMSLNIARAFQGIGSGLINPQIMGMIQHYFQGQERGRAYGSVGTTLGVSVAFGPLLGGLLISWLGADAGWRWTFLINVPIGVIAVILALRWFPRPLLTRTRSRARGLAPGAAIAGQKQTDMDPVGGALLGLAVLAVLMPFVQGRTNAWTWWLLPVGLLLMIAWVFWEKRYTARGKSPMADLSLFKIRSYTMGTAIAGLYFFGVPSVWVLVAIYVQQGQGFTALEAGFLGLPAAACTAVGAHLAGLRVMAYGRKIVIAGILCALAGLLICIAVIELHAIGKVGMWWLLLGLGALGLAQGAVISPNQALTMLRVPLNAVGSAAGVMQTSQRIGTAVGMAIITAIFFFVLKSSNWDIAMRVGLIAISVVVVATALVAFADQRRRTNNS